MVLSCEKFTFSVFVFVVVQPPSKKKINNSSLCCASSSSSRRTRTHPFYVKESGARGPFFVCVDDDDE
jgi:hypothetical protein